jgi:hypothetical protein
MQPERSGMFLSDKFQFLKLLAEFPRNRPAHAALVTESQMEERAHEKDARNFGDNRNCRCDDAHGSG